MIRTLGDKFIFACVIEIPCCVKKPFSPKILTVTDLWMGNAPNYGTDRFAIILNKNGNDPFLLRYGNCAKNGTDTVTNSDPLQ